MRSLGTTKGKKINDRADIVNCMSRSFIRIHSRKEKYNMFAFVSVIRPKHFSFHFTVRLTPLFNEIASNDDKALVY